MQQLFNLAVKGNMAAMRLLIGLVDNDNIPGAPCPQDGPETPAEPGDEAIIARFLARRGGGTDVEGDTREGDDE
ncbi:hypothetical protein F0L46_14970 [Salinarimonas soli]|uniref:Uncharacterized protein n=1 Tax=Salinarimonas soli TaxID=1638099 RepID=A0A5B2VDF4_9HYPH|nr:hypothetical protein F0L46_14970 [Salinarimonas soli]